MRKLPLLSLLILPLFLLTACDDLDLYAPCKMDSNALDEVQRACGQDSPTCIVKAFLGCETRLCARLRQSEPFCTLPCKEDKDCGVSSSDTEAKCIYFNPGTDAEKHCVSSDVLKQINKPVDNSTTTNPPTTNP